MRWRDLLNPFSDEVFLADRSERKLLKLDTAISIVFRVFEIDGFCICRFQNPDMSRANRVGEAHGGATGWGVGEGRDAGGEDAPERFQGGFKPNAKPFQRGEGLKPETLSGFKRGV